ncbi:hypothetical protein HD554DRAFT_725739 [Boletus coccyginus]|nr:hypothetical protein HD554DRAFT_725739 [Boletus coccyginus]
MHSATPCWLRRGHRGRSRGGQTFVNTAMEVAEVDGDDGRCARLDSALQLGACLHVCPRTHDPVDAFLLPDRTSVNIVQLSPGLGSPGKAEIPVDGVPVCTYHWHPLDCTAALLPSAVGTPHEHTATHAPAYPVLEIHPPSTRRITVQDAWAVIYTLFVRHHDQEMVSIVFSPGTVTVTSQSWERTFSARGSGGLRTASGRTRMPCSFCGPLSGRGLVRTGTTRAAGYPPCLL